ncbi:anti-sigma factor family protein [Flindersiella endophytica]
MTDPRDCEQVRLVLAELATGAAAGDERAAALQHVAGCEACRQELAQLARAADELLLLAPEREPPAGFESRVLARLQQQPAPRPGTTPDEDTPDPPHHADHLGTPGPAPTRPPAAGGPGTGPGRGDRADHSRWSRRTRTPGGSRPQRQAGPRWRGVLKAFTLTVAFLLAAGIGVGATWRATSDDRRVAEQHRKTLEVAGGRYLAAMPITASSGGRKGTAFLYQGNPSWMLVTITGAPVDGHYEMLVVGRDGVVHPGGGCEVSAGNATAGYRLYRPVSDVAAIQLNGPGGVRLTAHR